MLPVYYDVLYVLLVVGCFGLCGNMHRSLGKFEEERSVIGIMLIEDTAA